MKKNIIEIELTDFLVLLFFMFFFVSIVFFFIGLFFGKSGEYEEGYVIGYKQCIRDFNVTGVYYEIKRLPEKGN